MVSLNGGFNAASVPPAQTFDALPQGDYLAIMEESEIRATNDNNGSYFSLTFQIIEGEFKGRKLWANINWTNPKENAVSMGRAQLSSICRAVGVMNPNDTTDLHNRPLMLGVEHETYKGKLKNVIKSFKPASPAMAGAGNIAGAINAGSSKPAAAAAPPWAR